MGHCLKFVFFVILFSLFGCGNGKAGVYFPNAGGGASLPDGGVGAIWYQSDAGIAALAKASNGQVLTLDGGIPTWQTAGTSAAGVLFSLTGNPATDVNATTAETALFTYTLPGNTLPTNGAIHIQALCSAFNNSGGTIAQTYRLYFGATVFSTTSGTNGSSNSHDVVQTFDAWIVAAGATNAQYGEATSFANAGATNGGSALVETTANSQLAQTNVSFTVDSTTNQVIKLTSQSNSSNSNVHSKLYLAKVTLL